MGRATSGAAGRRLRRRWKPRRRRRSRRRRRARRRPDTGPAGRGCTGSRRNEAAPPADDPGAQRRRGGGHARVPERSGPAGRGWPSRVGSSRHRRARGRAGAGGVAAGHRRRWVRVEPPGLRFCWAHRDHTCFCCDVPADCLPRRRLCKSPDCYGLRPAYGVPGDCSGDREVLNRLLAEQLPEMVLSIIEELEARADTRPSSPSSNAHSMPCRRMKSCCIALRRSST